MNETIPTEAEVRALRDAVYGAHFPPGHHEQNWQNCKANWMKPEAVAWLRARKENREIDTK